MLAFVIVLQVLVALFLIMVVLLQPGNRGGASAALGGAGSDTVFGARGANTFLSKITFGAAVCFMVTNFMLSYMSGSQKSVLDSLEKTPSKKTEAPVQGEQKDKAKDGQEAAAPVATDGEPQAVEPEAPSEGSVKSDEAAPADTNQ